MRVCADFLGTNSKTKSQKDYYLLIDAANIAIGLIPLAPAEDETEIWVKMEDGKPVHVFSPDIDIAEEELARLGDFKDGGLSFLETNSALQQLVIDELSKLDFGDVIIKVKNKVPEKLRRKSTYRITEKLSPINKTGADTADRIMRQIDGYIKQFSSTKNGKVSVRLVDGRPLTITVEVDTMLLDEYRTPEVKKQPWYKQIIKKELLQINFGYLTVLIANGSPIKVKKESSLKIVL